jgi:8-amino-7-oxononanoate synthase
MYNDDFLDKKLAERREQNAFRVLRLPGDKIDFCSNDYLGIVHDCLLEHEGSSLAGSWKHGSAGSRLLAGNYALIEEVERGLALFHGGEAALVFNSGYDANVGLLSAVAQKGDTIIYDKLAHASIRDGIRLSFAQAFSFAHNDLADLENKLTRATGNVFVVTESVFSMDGDTCPLSQVIVLCKRYNAHLIIDEAHAIGVVGEKGEGLAQHLNMHEDCFARVYTFGKACGCHGAVIVGSQQLRDYLVNFARSFIFSTSLPEVAVAAIRRSYSLFPDLLNERRHLQELITMFKEATLSYEKLDSATPIQGVIVAGNSEAKKVADLLQQNNFDIRPILYPTVPKGKERLRIVLHAFNTIEQVRKVIGLLSSKD